MTLGTWILVLAVFAAVVLTRLGRHRYTRRQRLLTLAVVAILVVKYVRGMPTTGNDGVLEGLCAGIGVLFGVGMLMGASVERDRDSAQIWVRAGFAYLALWIVMLGTRIAFAYSATGFGRSAIGRFFATHHLTSGAITPAFVLMTVGSLVVVTIGVALRASVLAGTTAPTAPTSDSVHSDPNADDRGLFGHEHPRLLGHATALRGRLGG